MSKRDHELARTKYAGCQSASEKAREAKSGAKGSRSTAEELRLAPRSQDSIDRAAKHKRGLPRLG